MTASANRAAAACFAIGVLTIMAASGSADAATPSATPERPGRYSMSPVDGGFMRLDTETGAMALCNKKGESWACEPIAGAPTAPGRSEREELERLRAENAEMRATIKSLEELVLGPEGEKRADKPGGGLQLPSEQDVDKALDYVERMFKKFRDRLKQLEGGGKDGTPL